MRARLVYSLLVLIALAFPVLAQDRRGGGSLDRVLPEIRRNVPGTFYDAEGPFFTPDGRAMYRIKWMTPDGRMIWFNVDARTGQVMGGMPARQRFRDDGVYDRRNDWHDRDNDRDGWRDRDRDNWRDRGGDRGGWGDRSGNRDGDRDRGGNKGGWGNDRGGSRGGDHGGRGGDRGGDRGGGRGDRRHGG